MALRRFLRRLILPAAALAVVGAGALAVVRYSTSVQTIRPPDGAAPEAKAIAFLPTDWPGWRGPRGDNRAAAAEAVPSEWTAETGIAWKVAVPGVGHSSPVIRGARVFLTTADGDAITMRSYDRLTGAEGWAVELQRGGLMAKHDKNSHASGTPACDGEKVYAAFIAADAVWAAAVTEAGELAWKKEAGPFVSEWGYGSSVALDGGRVYVCGDSRGGKLARLRATSFLAALDRNSGDVVWRVGRPEERSYGTPALAGDTVLMGGPRGLFGYDARTGDERWLAKWGPTRSGNTPAVAGEVAVASGAFEKKETVCVRLGDGSVVWRKPNVGGDIPSPLVVGPRVYVPNEDGTVACLALKDGKTLWKERVAEAGVSASPVEVGGLIYLCDEAGTVTVFRDADEIDVVSRNPLRERILASPAVSGGRLYVRSATTLWCIGPKQPPEKP